MNLAECFTDYMHEEEGYETYVSTIGFCCYKIEGDGLFCGHVFVDRSKRGRGIDFGLELENFARKMKCTHMMGNIYRGDDDNKYVRKLRFFLAMGFRILKQDNNCACVVKDI